MGLPIVGRLTNQLTLYQLFQLYGGAAAVFQLGHAAVPGFVIADKAYCTVRHGQPIHAPRIQCGNRVRVDVPGRGLLIKDAAWLRALML